MRHEWYLDRACYEYVTQQTEAEPPDALALICLQAQFPEGEGKGALEEYQAQTGEWLRGFLGEPVSSTSFASERAVSVVSKYRAGTIVRLFAMLSDAQRALYEAEVVTKDRTLMYKPLSRELMSISAQGPEGALRVSVREENVGRGESKG